MPQLFCQLLYDIFLSIFMIGFTDIYLSIENGLGIQYINYILL